MPGRSSLKEACASAIETCAGYNVRRSARIVTALYDAAFARTELRLQQVTMLQMIAAEDRPSITQLAGDMAKDPSTVSRALGPLMREGLIELVPAERGKAKLICLTSVGWLRLDEIMAPWSDAQSELIERFGSTRWNKLRGELRVLSETADRL